MPTIANERGKHKPRVQVACSFGTSSQGQLVLIQSWLYLPVISLVRPSHRVYGQLRELNRTYA